MQTPYQVLDVSAEASDEQIKQAYLKKVKDYPPDRNQQQFQLVHEAYRSIKDIKSRAHFALFTIPIADFDELIDVALTTKHLTVPKIKQLKEFLSVSIDDELYLNTLESMKKMDYKKQ